MLVLFSSFKAVKNVDLYIGKGSPSFIPFHFQLQKLVGKREVQIQSSNQVFLFFFFRIGLFSPIDCSLCFEKWYCLCNFQCSALWLWECCVGSKRKSSFDHSLLSLVKLYSVVPVALCRSSRFTAPDLGQVSGVPVCGIPTKKPHKPLLLSVYTFLKT